MDAEKRKEYARNYRATHKEEIKAGKKRYTESHKEQKKATDHKNYLKNQEKRKASAKLYRAANLEACNQRSRDYHEVHKEERKNHRLNNHVIYWARNSIHKHRQAGYNVEFSADQLISMAATTKHCSICGQELDWSGGKGRAGWNSPSIDRIDNNDILRLDNVQIICRHCNTTKLDRTMAEFVKYCKMVVDKFSEATA